MTGQAEFLHALRQPVNVIRLTVANIGVRMLPRLGGEDEAYLTDRLAVIEGQIQRLVEITEQRD